MLVPSNQSMDKIDKIHTMKPKKGTEAGLVILFIL